MSRFLAEYWFSEEAGISACRHCCRRNSCPYSLERAAETMLRAAVSQNRSAADHLTAECQRHLTAISRADSISGLLHTNRTLEDTLLHTLRSETALIAELSRLSKQIQVFEDST